MAKHLDRIKPALTDQRKQDVLSILPLLITAHSPETIKTLIGDRLSGEDRKCLLDMQETVKGIVNGRGIDPNSQTLVQEMLENKELYPMARYLLAAAYALKKLKDENRPKYFAVMLEQNRNLKVGPLSAVWQLRIEEPKRRLYGSRGI